MTANAKRVPEETGSFRMSSIDLEAAPITFSDFAMAATRQTTIAPSFVCIALSTPRRSVQCLLCALACKLLSHASTATIGGRFRIQLQ